MPIQVLMPALSPTMEKGNLAKWLKKEGETIKSGDVIAEIETDKATMEVEATDEGTLGKILIPEGTADVAVNTPIATILADGESAADLAKTPAPKAQPVAMVQQLFDEYADRFDKHLVEYLKYDLPKRVARMIREKHPDLAVSVLDLGCGTGLLGASLGRIGGAFVGVDLSQKMLEQAKRLDVYSRLRLNDLLDELRLIEAESFDYVTANDVFIYVGDVSAVIPAIHRVLRRGGTLIFSCEAASESEDALVLRPSRRYAHSRKSIEALCRDAGFSYTFEPMVLREDGDGAPAVTGFLVTANKA